MEGNELGERRKWGVRGLRAKEIHWWDSLDNTAPTFEKNEARYRGRPDIKTFFQCEHSLLSIYEQLQTVYTVVAVEIQDHQPWKTRGSEKTRILNNYRKEEVVDRRK